MSPAEHIAWIRKFWPSLYGSVPHEFTHHVESVCDAYEALAAAARAFSIHAATNHHCDGPTLDALLALLGEAP